MDIKFVYTDEGINWAVMSDLYRKAPLGNKSATELKSVFNNSIFKCFLFDGNTLIGAGRALADGVDCSYICDIALLPEYQGKGIGSKIVDYLVKESKEHKKIILYSVPGSENFYKKAGFKKMSTAMALFKNQEWAEEIGLLSDT